MTTVAAILTEAICLGIELWVHDGHVRYRPRSQMTIDLAERIRSHKSELLTILRAGDTEADPVVARSPPDLAPSDWVKWSRHTRDVFEERLAICLESDDVSEAVAVRIAMLEARRTHCRLA